MARQYPRFLFSDPQNTKSKGPFIIHTIYPRMIMKVSERIENDEKLFRTGFSPKYIYLIETFEEDLPMKLVDLENQDMSDIVKIMNVLNDAFNWYKSNKYK